MYIIEYNISTVLLIAFLITCCKCRILGPNSNRVDNESNPDNDMSTNEDI